MPKLYTQTVRECAECPHLAGLGSYWCPKVRRKLYPLPQVPPKDCPLPDAKEEEARALEGEA